MDNGGPQEREQQTRDSQELFRLLVDGVKDYAIFVLDTRGNVVSWNTGAQQIKGYSASEIIGTHFSRFYTPEDIARDWPNRELKDALAQGRLEDEGWRVRKDGSRFWANVIITPLYDPEGRWFGFAKVTRDLTARRTMEAMQETERQLNEFLAMLGHELRNPLAAIVNARRLMRSDPRQAGEAGAVIDRQSSHLTRIIDDLLDVSRVTLGKIVLSREILDLNAIVISTVEACRPSIDARKHEVEMLLSNDALLIDADATRLSQVILNLVSNAVKYTQDAGHIGISTGFESNDSVLRIRDNGMGIATHLLPTIFDLFVQGETSLARTEGGLGIGLTLVKRLVELQGGAVEAFSEGPGKGSEFIVRFPRIFRGHVAQEERPQPTDISPVARRRVLVVDDNRDSAAMLAALLEVTGHDVRLAHDGPTALSLAAFYHPDVVLLDIGLPGMNGYEVARKLRGSSALAAATLIAITGYGQDEDRRRTKEAGFDHHLVKPTDFDELTRIIGLVPARL